MKRILAVLIFLLLLGGAGWAGFYMSDLWPTFAAYLEDRETNPAIRIHEAGNVSAAARRDVELATEKFPLLLHREMGTGLRHSVDVYIAASEDDYAAVLRKQFDLSADDAREVAAVSGGWSGGRIRTTAINGTAGVMDTSGERIATTGHELFHQVQYELSHGNDTNEQALFWLSEGSADYIGALLADQYGGRPFAKWQMDVLDALLATPKVIRPESLMHLDFEQRKAVMARENHAYQMADLMTWYLLQRYPREEANDRLKNYFYMLGEKKDGEAAFARAFGMSSADYLQEFSAWWQQQKQQPAEIHYEVRAGVTPEMAAAVKEEVRKSQDFLTKRFGRTLGGAYTIILTNSRDDMVQAAAAMAGMSEEEANDFSGDSLWVESGSTILLNVANLTDERQRIFNLAVMTARVFEAQNMGAESKEVAWLSRGIAYLAGTGRLEEAGYGTLPDYRRAWLETLRQGRDIPNVVHLETKQGFEEASASLGSERVSAVTELAAASLLDRRGWSGFYRWMRAVGARDETGEEAQAGRDAFRAVYGQDTAAFADSLCVQLSHEMYTR